MATRGGAGAGGPSHDAFHHHHLAALRHWGQGGQAPDIRVLSSVFQVVEAPDGLRQVLPALSHGPLGPEEAAQEVEGHT